MPAPARRVSVALFLSALLFTACQSLGLVNTKPVVVISGPPSGALYTVGQDVVVSSISTDPQGISRVELLVDSVSVRTDPSPVAQGQAQFQVLQAWKAAGIGTHTVTVRAYNTAGGFGEAGITVMVNETSAQGPTPGSDTSVPGPLDTAVPLATQASETAAPISTAVPPPTLTPGAVGCAANSAFVLDVTVPDGSVLAPGAAFTKAWRVQNIGSCAWDTSYAIMWVGGAQLAAQTAFPISPAAPGSIVDIAIPLVAPAAPGAYQSIWRLRDSYGNPFGTNLTVVINVANPSPPTPTRTRTPLANAPIITSFNCSPCVLSPGQPATLTWGLVRNATAVTIEPGIGGVATPGSIVLFPPITTTFTMTAVGPGGTTQLSLTVTVNAIANFAGYWYTNFGDMNVTQNGANVTGAFFNGFILQNGTLTGHVAGNTLDGSYSIAGVSGSIHWVLGPSVSQFNGNGDGSRKWCGARSGTEFPNGCSYDGHWNTSGTGVCPNGTMELQRINLSVTGTYCGDRTVNGSISYAGEQTVLNGTWFDPPAASGTFTFYLVSYAAQQFRGNWGPSNAWCGWRNGVAQPVPCLQ